MLPLASSNRSDLPRIDVPTPVIHGDEDRILLIGATTQRLPGLIKARSRRDLPFELISQDQSAQRLMARPSKV
jgi:hypothetical protein